MYVVIIFIIIVVIIITVVYCTLHQGQATTRIRRGKGTLPYQVIYHYLGGNLPINSYLVILIQC